MKKLYSSQDRVKIYLLKASLESQGIACFIKNENPPLAGEIPPMIAWPEYGVWTINKPREQALSLKTNYRVSPCPNRLGSVLNAAKT
jgi:hypothetical protein